MISPRGRAADPSWHRRVLTTVLTVLFAAGDDRRSPRREGLRNVPRLPGDPSVAGWLLFSIGFRLPPRNREWVRHELTDAGWRGRTIGRLMVLMIPVCVALAFLPGPAWLRIAVPALALIASVGTVAMSADDVRAARLKQHGLEVPDDPDLGRPTH
jgi:hypothetical protein